jgi:hypothetical protein
MSLDLQFDLIIATVAELHPNQHPQDRNFIGDGSKYLFCYNMTHHPRDSQHINQSVRRRTSAQVLDLSQCNHVCFPPLFAVFLFTRRLRILFILSSVEKVGAKPGKYRRMKTKNVVDSLECR